MTTGEMIKHKRESEGLNQKQFAARLGISQSYLTDLEHNRRYLTLWLARRLDGTMGYEFRACVLLDHGWSAGEILGVQDYCYKIEELRQLP